MKYRVKVKVRNDMESIFIPMVKTHWWSFWRVIKLMYNGVCFTKEQAEEAINAYDNSRIVRTYYIDVETMEE